MSLKQCTISIQPVDGFLHFGTKATLERRRIDFFEFNFPIQHGVFPPGVYRLIRLKFWHNVLCKQLERLADMFIGIAASLVQQNDLVDMR